MSSPEIEALREEALGAFDVVPGFFSREEATLLFDSVQKLPEEQPVCCELGTWLGKTTVLLGIALRGKHDPRLYTIDPFAPRTDASWDRDWQLEALEQQVGDAHADRLTLVEEHVARFSLQDTVTIVRGLSSHVVEGFEHQIDLLFIDADHGYEETRRDFDLWSPLVPTGGFVAFHDYGSPVSGHEGPSRVVEESVQPSEEWRVVGISGLLLVARRNPMPRFPRMRRRRNRRRG